MVDTAACSGSSCSGMPVLSAPQARRRRKYTFGTRLGRGAAPHTSITVEIERGSIQLYYLHERKAEGATIALL